MGELHSPGRQDHPDNHSASSQQGSSPSSPDSSSSSSHSSSSSSDSSSSPPSGDPNASSRQQRISLKEKYSLNDKTINVNGKLRSKIDFLLQALCLAYRHNLSDVAIEDLIKSYNCQLGAEIIPSSIWLFHKIFSCDSGLEYHFFCRQCEAYLGEKSVLEGQAVNNLFTCPIQLCKCVCDVLNMNDGHFFVMLPLKYQLKCFLETQPNIDELLSYRFTRDSSDGTVRDIFDGLLYKKLSKPGGILHDRNNLSVTLFTDGAKIFLSGSNSMWPIMCRLNELPPTMRFDVENIFVTGLWFGRSHPNMTVYLSQFVEDARNLYEKGFDWTKSDGEVVHTKVATPN